MGADKGELAKLAIPSSVDQPVVGQLQGVSASYLPDNLELLGRSEKAKLGINIASCGAFHISYGFAEAVGDKSNIEDSMTQAKLPQAAQALFGADRVLYYWKELGIGVSGKEKHS